MDDTSLLEKLMNENRALKVRNRALEDLCNVMRDRDLKIGLMIYKLRNRLPSVVAEIFGPPMSSERSFQSGVRQLDRHEGMHPTDFE